MPGLQSTTGYLNAAFGRENIRGIVGSRGAFAPGETLSKGLSSILDSHTPLFKALVPYVDSLPVIFQESMRSTIFYALSTAPPTQITFAWAPGYDYELTIWQAPDTSATRGGITVLLKSRYPSDPHPISRAANPPRKRKT